VKRQLLTCHDAVKTKVQHTKPCSDCPWARRSLPGWLGNSSAEEWIELAYSEGYSECHTTDKRCAGFAIFQANICKVPRDPRAFRLPPDTEVCFANSSEFLTHHNRTGESKWKGRC
jgi:hypothetical protein